MALLQIFPKWLIVLVLLGYTTQPSASEIKDALQAETAVAAVQIAMEEVLDLIAEGQVYANENPNRFYSEVGELLDPMIDFRFFARYVMGVWYKQATSEQFARFSESFKWHLVKTYALALVEFHEGEVRIVRARNRDSKRAAVSMQIDWQEKSYSVIYDMRKRGDIWQLVNLSIEGVNLALNFKSQFDSAMKGPKFDRDMDKVIDAWTKNSNVEPSGTE